MEFWIPPWYNNLSMFTGMIEDLGKVMSLLRFNDRAEIAISTRFLADLKVSDSVCVNGVCLTVSQKKSDAFRSIIMKETLDRSTFSRLKIGDLVNIERSMPASGRFDGHIVQGHVDCRAMIANIIVNGALREIEIKLPANFSKYVTEKGSIAVDGVSLTVSSLYEGSFKAAIVPHTALNTNLFHKKIGDWVNLEFDVLAKYLEKFIKKNDFASLIALRNTKIDESFLQKAGFLN